MAQRPQEPIATQARHAGTCADAPVVYDDEEIAVGSSLLGDDPAMLVAALAPDGRLVHVSEVGALPPADLRCPACRSDVIAVRGPVRAHHFRHRVAGSCAGGAETALHLLAKRILTEVPKLAAPAIVARLGRREATLRGPSELRLDGVRLEAREDGFTPDVAAVAEGAPLFIEIAVTHRVDAAKRARLAARGVSTLEINLSRLPARVGYAEVAKAIGRDAPRRWLYSRLAATHEAQMRRAAQAAEAQEAARVARAAEAAVAAFTAPGAEPPPDRDAGPSGRVALLGLRPLVESAHPTDAAFSWPGPAWRGLVIERFLLAPCDAVVAYGAFRHTPGTGFGEWSGYPVARFSVEDVLGALQAAGAVKPGLARLEPAVVETARLTAPEIGAAIDAVAAFVEDACDAGALEDGADWGGGRTLAPSRETLLRVWREAELRRLALQVDAALRGGVADAAAVEAWLAAHAGPEIRGEPVAERILPRLKALADLAGALMRRSGAGMSQTPPALAAAAGRLGLAP